MTIKCKCCGKKPHEIPEYIEMAKENECTPEIFVIMEEGTFNKKTGLFYCTHCYIKCGCPIGKA